MPADQRDGEAPTQNRSCSRCSEAQRNQDPSPLGVSSQYDDNAITPLIRSLLKNANTPYLNQYQSVNNRGETATIVPDRERTTGTTVRANDSPRVPTAEVLT